MAAAYQTKFSNNNDLAGLRIHLATLEKEHESRQQEYKHLHKQHGKKCVTSMRDSMKSLLEVIVFVRKADKSLIDWHHRSPNLKTALRIVGLDRSTNAVIEKKTHKLQDKVQHVEKKMDKTSLVFDNGLKETKRMKSGFLDFSTGDVEKASQKALSIRDTYENLYDQVDTLVKQQNAEHENAQSTAEDMAESLEAKKQSHGNAEQAREGWTLGTCAGLGAAAISAVVFPPSLLTTGSLLVASAVAGRNALSYSGQVQDLKAQERSLALALSKHDASVEALKADLAKSTQNRNVINKAIEEVDAFHNKSLKFRAESQRSLNMLYIIQTNMEKIQGKLRVMTKELHECRYEESRRGISRRLQDVINVIQDVPMEIKSASVKEIDNAVRELIQIDEKTREVLEIAQLSAQA